MSVGWADVTRDLVIVERSGEKLDVVLKLEARPDEIGGRVGFDRYAARVLSEVKTDQPQANSSPTNPKDGDTFSEDGSMQTMSNGSVIIQNGSTLELHRQPESPYPQTQNQLFHVGYPSNEASREGMPPNHIGSLPPQQSPYWSAQESRSASFQQPYGAREHHGAVYYHLNPEPHQPLQQLDQLINTSPSDYETYHTADRSRTDSNGTGDNRIPPYQSDGSPALSAEAIMFSQRQVQSRVASNRNQPQRLRQHHSSFPKFQQQPHHLIINQPQYSQPPQPQQTFDQRLHYPQHSQMPIQNGHGFSPMSNNEYYSGNVGSERTIEGPTNGGALHHRRQSPTMSYSSFYGGGAPPSSASPPLGRSNSANTPLNSIANQIQQSNYVRKQRPWAMWAGNVASNSTSDELWSFFGSRSAPASGSTGSASQYSDSDLVAMGITRSHLESPGVQSIHLIDKSNCAFINYLSDIHLQHAIRVTNGIPLRPNDWRCKDLITRMRKTDEAKATERRERTHSGDIHRFPGVEHSNRAVQVFRNDIRVPSTEVGPLRN